jgi:predicted dehydrogenase
MTSPPIQSTAKQVAMAVIGYGHFGRIHAQKVADSNFAKLVAVADVEAERAAEAAQALGVEGVRDYRELLGKVDAVSVVVPTVAHYEVANAFLSHGADVLVEKPITDDPATAAKLVETAKRNGRILQVGHLERFTSVAELLRERLQRPLFIESLRIAPYQPRGTDVNVILDLMIHDLDLVLSLVDSPIVSVEAAGGAVFSRSEDIANARIKFANGCIANIASSRISLKRERKMRIFEVDRYVTVDFVERKIRSISNPSGKPPATLSDVEVVDKAYAEDDPLQKEIDAFAVAAAGGGTPLVSGDDGKRALEAAIMVNDSMATHAAFVEQGQAGAKTSKGAA